MHYLEQKKEIIDGISYNYLCHIHNVEAEGNVFPAHYHSYIEILYGISGIYKVLLNGEAHLFKQGDLVIINSKEVHQIDSHSCEGGKYIVLRFEPEVIYNTMFQDHLQLKYVLPFILENGKHQKVIDKSEIENTFIPKLLYEMLDEFEMRSYGYELAIKNHIGRIFLWLLRYFHKQGIDIVIDVDVNRETMKRLQPAFDYVLHHYDEEIKAAELANLCNMSYSYFSRTFNEYLGMNLSEYINRIRITEAEKLLISTTLNITEVAHTVGFSTTSYFIKLFQLYKNTSPKQFRKGYKIAKSNNDYPQQLKYNHS
ncbi:AraC family transcriptional regulator [Cellulosilyticum sp. ST5]|uniref:helix-turn-helix transcriptional regulator n=1 Tax=unclassified Cellulosilyticum TaxID=2643091 RepID=UPI000F8F1D7C|nr:AraC family transcriptional regulator [Cellulosilyticum sp. WCF-2]QEH68104.1 AraC family transcriptional regulator [Cellulosilyticum sp. WCF-2]